MCNVQTKILIFIKKGERFLIQEKLDFIIYNYNIFYNHIYFGININFTYDEHAIQNIVA